MDSQENTLKIKELGPVRELTQGDDHVVKDTRAGHRKQ